MTEEVQLTAAEADAAIDALLKEAGIKFNCVYVGEVTRGEGRKVDLWQVGFEGKNHSFLTDYTTGTGLRKALYYPHRNSADEAMRKVTAERKNPHLAAARRGSRIDQRMVDQWDAANKKPVLPTAGSVLYCLNMDRQACMQSFKSWCADLGFNDDSIKDRAMYDKCLEIGEDFMKVFTNGLPDKISEILQDY